MRSGRVLVRVARWLRAVIVLVLMAGAFSGSVAGGDELPGGDYVTLCDADGNVICQTGFALEVGDEYVDEQNALWRVDRVNGSTAVAVYVRTLDLGAAVEDFQASLAASPSGGQQVGIYHTHSDESYIPSDGTESDPAGHGGVYRVGDALAAGLQQAGLKVIHSPANHMPHDGGAYERSRRTAAEVLRGSAAIFDVHRDAAPPEAYQRVIGGTPVTQVMVVLGRANPQADANASFAEAIKAAADRVQPGLIRGILKTSGRFNQDLSSHALLFEVGAHTNRREEAEAAVTKLAGIIPTVLGAQAAGTRSAGAWRAVGIILLLVVVGGGLWLFIASGGNWRVAWNKLRSLGEEFASYFGRRRARR